MRSQTAFALLSLAAATSPALSAPVATPNEARAVSLGGLGGQLGKGILTGAGLTAAIDGIEHLLGADGSSRKRELNDEDIAVLKRAVSLGGLGGQLGKGILTGAGLTAAIDGIEHLIGGDSSSKKRDLSDEDIAVLKRAVSLGSLGGQLGKGILTGAGLTAAIDGIEHLIGGDSSQPQRRGLASILGGAAEDTIGDVIKKGAASGVGSAIGGAAIGGLIDEFTGSNKRDLSYLEARGLASILGGAAEDTIGDVIKKGAASGIGSAIGGAAIGGLIDEFTGNNKRELSGLEARGLASILGGAAEDTIGDVIKKGAASGVGSAIGGAAIGGLISEFTGDNKRDLSGLEARGLASILGGAAEDTIGDVIKKGAASGVGSAIGGAAIGGLISEFTGNNKRELSYLEARGLASILGGAAEDTIGDVIKKGAASGVGSAIGGAAIGGLISEFTGNDNSKREPLNLGPIEKGLLGTGVSLGVSSLVGDGIDKVEGLFGGSSSKRDLEAREPLNLGPVGKGLLGTGVSIGVSELVGDGIDKVEGLFGGSSSKRDLKAREPLNLGPIEKGLLGTGVSLGVSSLVGDGIDKIEGLFGGNQKRSIDDLD